MTNTREKWIDKYSWPRTREDEIDILNRSIELRRAQRDLINGRVQGVSREIERIRSARLQRLDQLVEGASLKALHEQRMVQSYPLEVNEWESELKYEWNRARCEKKDIAGDLHLEDARRQRDYHRAIRETCERELIEQETTRRDTLLQRAPAYATDPELLELQKEENVYGEELQRHFRDRAEIDKKISHLVSGREEQEALAHAELSKNMALTPTQIRSVGQHWREQNHDTVTVGEFMRQVKERTHTRYPDRSLTDITRLGAGHTPSAAEEKAHAYRRARIEAKERRDTATHSRER